MISLAYPISYLDQLPIYQMWGRWKHLKNGLVQANACQNLGFRPELVLNREEVEYMTQSNPRPLMVQRNQDADQVLQNVQQFFLLGIITQPIWSNRPWPKMALMWDSTGLTSSSLCQNIFNKQSYPRVEKYPNSLSSLATRMSQRSNMLPGIRLKWATLLTMRI